MSDPTPIPTPLWQVHVFFDGISSGAYDHPTREAAEEDAAWREQTMGVLGFWYRVVPFENPPQ